MFSSTVIYYVRVVIKMTQSYEKLRIMRYRLDENTMFTSGNKTLNILFSIKSINHDS